MSLLMNQIKATLWLVKRARCLEDVAADETLPLEDRIVASGDAEAIRAEMRVQAL